jgi:hypothetical protein
MAPGTARAHEKRFLSIAYPSSQSSMRFIGPTISLIHKRQVPAAPPSYEDVSGSNGR